MTETTREVLEQAKQIVLRGWCQGSYTDGQGNYCLKGAIGLAAGVLKDEDGHMGYKTLDLPELRLDRDAYARVVEQLPEPFESIPTYNDWPETTKADVLVILDKAIAAC